MKKTLLFHCLWTWLAENFSKDVALQPVQPELSSPLSFPHLCFLAPVFLSPLTSGTRGGFYLLVFLYFIFLYILEAVWIKPPLDASALLLALILFSPSLYGCFCTSSLLSMTRCTRKCGASALPVSSACFYCFGMFFFWGRLQTWCVSQLLRNFFRSLSSSVLTRAVNLCPQSFAEFQWLAWDVSGYEQEHYRILKFSSSHRHFPFRYFLYISPSTFWSLVLCFSHWNFLRWVSQRARHFRTAPKIQLFLLPHYLLRFGNFVLHRICTKAWCARAASNGCILGKVPISWCLIYA